MLMKLACATSNKQKFEIGNALLANLGIELVQKPVHIDEIQGENVELVIRDKVMKAYEILQEPVIVTDDWWDIPALGGFPGAYMKSINSWFLPQDFVDLMQHKSDRQIILHAYLAYFDGEDLHYFHHDLRGTIAKKTRGDYGPPIMHVVELDFDGGRTISEIYDEGLEHETKRLQSYNSAWIQLGQWLKEKI